MLDKETYLKELTRYFNSVRDDKYNGEAEPTSCIGVSCDDCIFNKEVKKERKCILAIKYIFDVLEIIENWSKEHPPKKFKVSKLEYDIMRAAIDYSSEEEAFKDVDILYELLINGYFKGAKSSDKVIDFFKNCEVSDDV